MTMPDLYVPMCPTCGDPVTSGCYPADGICAVVDDDDFDEPDPGCRCATTRIPPCAFCEGSTDPDSTDFSPNPPAVTE